MADDELTPLIFEGHEIDRVRLAPPDHENRREINLGLGIVQLPSLLERFRPVRAMPPQERFLVLLRLFVEAMNDGKRNQLDENDLAKGFMGTHGPASFMHLQVRRASGDAVCGDCQKTYGQHRFERALLREDGQPYIHRLCNGDLVKL